VFNSYRQRKDGRFANCTYALDRDGDVVAVYDKVYPTPDEIEWKELPIVPGEGPVAVDTDFGRLSFATCFDLNFRDLLMATAALKPDVIAFCSAYNGDFWQRTWSYTCRSYLVGCTVGTLARAGRDAEIDRTALVLVGRFLDAPYEKSRLYDPSFTTGYREGSA
jgi:predicted amidohydrolase